MVLAYYETINPPDERGSGLKNILLRNFEKRFKAVENVHELGIATLIDPRFKKKGFLLPERVSRTVQLIKDEASRLSELTQGKGAQFTKVKNSSLVLSWFY